MHTQTNTDAQQRALAELERLGCEIEKVALDDPSEALDASFVRNTPGLAKKVDRALRIFIDFVVSSCVDLPRKEQRAIVTEIMLTNTTKPVNHLRWRLMLARWQDTLAILQALDSNPPSHRKARYMAQLRARCLAR